MFACLSSSDNAASKQKIASFTGWTYPKEWNKYSTQKSSSVYLEKGKKYYIEALHKEAYGGDNLAVAWTTPNSSTITVIPGSVLSPVISTISKIESSQINAVQDFSLNVFPNPFEDKITIAIGGLSGTVNVLLTDIVGKQYFQQHYQIAINRKPELEIDLSAMKLNKGMYLLKLQTKDGQSQIVKIIKG